MSTDTSALLKQIEALPGFENNKHSGLLRALRKRIEKTPEATPELPSDKDLSRWIDHTLLSPDGTPEEIQDFLEDCKEHNFASACLHPCYVPVAKESLADSEVKICTVIGFPLGATLPSVKRFETNEVIRAGAQEVDMVLSIGALKAGEWSYVREDISYVVEAAEEVDDDIIVKVILETALLTDAEIAVACLLAKEAGADFVKTSTGFSKGGATLEDVRLMHLIVGGSLGIKASGGVGSRDDAHAMIEAGATRIGASGSIKIVRGATSASTY